MGWQTVMGILAAPFSKRGADALPAILAPGFTEPAALP
jgi:hypothetical protein